LKTILHTIETGGPGGAETICLELASGLDRSRFRSCSAVVAAGWMYQALQKRGLDPEIIPTGRGLADLAFLWRLGLLARRKRAAIFQSHMLEASLYSAIVARVLGVPAIATFHGMVDVSPHDRWAGVKLKLISANVFRLVFVSETLRRHFLRTHGIADHRTTVIPNGIDAEHFRPAPHAGLRLELGVPDTAVLVGAVGNIRPAKGYDELLRVAARLRASHPDIRFVVAGGPDQPVFDQVLALRRDLHLEDVVTFLGFRDDVARVLNGVDLYLSTSTSEGFSLSTIQAMACGLPVVATRSGGPEDIVTDGRDGFLVPVGDTAGIARVVADLAADVTRRRQLGESGRQTVLQRFTLGRMVSAYEAIYDEALAARTRHRRQVDRQRQSHDRSSPRWGS
jgi:glycosyltransferase involved in cell wall biosynthesis